jgi:hypothetical protein
MPIATVSKSSGGAQAEPLLFRSAGELPLFRALAQGPFPRRSHAMSVRISFSRDLLMVVLLASLPTLFVSSAQAGDVSRIHADAKEGQAVTVVGHVVSISRNVRFTLEDASGDRILTVIPDHLQRTVGTPAKGETIRVQGKYDHKTFLDGDKSTKAAKDKNWGIRVSAVERNLSSSGRNPTPDPAMSHVRPDSKASPAAPMSAVTIATPNTTEDLKNRLSIARKRALGAQKVLGNVRAEVARGIHRNVEGAEKAALAAREERAQREYDAAIGAIAPLVEEARDSGLDPKLIELYEAGITQPAR